MLTSDNMNADGVGMHQHTMCEMSNNLVKEFMVLPEDKKQKEKMGV